MTDLLDDEQLLALSAALDREPTNPDRYYARGKRRAELSDYVGAIEDFSRAIVLDPRNPAYYVERGDCYHGLGDTNRCIADENRAIELDPYNADYYVRRGRSYFSQRNYEESVRDFNRAARLEPEQAHIYYLRGTAYAANREWEHAVADCTKALEMQPDRADYHSGLGMAYICEHGWRDDYDRSIECLTRAVELAPQGVVYRQQRANSYWYKGRLDEALADYDHAISLDPKNAGTYYLRGTLKRQKGDRAAALLDLQVAAEMGDKRARREMHPLVRFLNGILSNR